MLDRVAINSDAPPPSTIKAYLVATLREAIIAGKFKPGERLNESKLARQYNVSRIPSARRCNSCRNKDW